MGQDNGYFHTYPIEFKREKRRFNVCIPSICKPKAKVNQKTSKEHIKNGA